MVSSRYLSLLRLGATLVVSVVIVVASWHIHTLKEHAIATSSQLSHSRSFEDSVGEERDSHCDNRENEEDENHSYAEWVTLVWDLVLVAVHEVASLD